MTSAIEKPPSAKPDSHRNVGPQDAHLGVACPRRVWNPGSAEPGAAEDQVIFRRWRMGFFIFYAATILLLGALGVVADRPDTSASAAASANSTMASADAIKRRHP
jgi:hypothetical protein